MSSLVESAIADALESGKALCKVITRNNLGLTGSHEYGFYLPKSAWRMFSPQSPEKGVNYKSDVRVRWQMEVVTNSAVTWYGIGTRSEYRLTKFGRDFEWLKPSYLGAWLVLVPFSLEVFHAYVFESDEEIELLTSALGIETLGGWGIFDRTEQSIETENECLERVFGERLKDICSFPSGLWMAEQAREAAKLCTKGGGSESLDASLLRWVHAEYQLFRTLEKKICLPDIRGPFVEIDDFLARAATIMNRRKSRAGHSLEYHVEHLLKSQGLPFDRQPRIDGKIRPDLLIPGKSAYNDRNFPVDRQMVVGIKTTCKDRWRQILNEGKRISEKHLLTLQEAISTDQLVEMRDANVTLVVPEKFHNGYDLDTGIRLLSIDGFVEKIRGLAA
jgi:hypothetical protein